VVVLSARDVTAEERDRLSRADRVLRKGDASLQDIAMELHKLDSRQLNVDNANGVGEEPRASEVALDGPPMERQSL
jgi:hypothetical protein